MTDLELTKLCAGAMGFKLPRAGNDWWSGEFIDGGREVIYDPLHNDDQALKLVKNRALGIWIHRLTHRNPPEWYVSNGEKEVFGPTFEVTNIDLNRAICECMAKMQLAKVEADRRFGQPHHGHNRENT